MRDIKELENLSTELRSVDVEVLRAIKSGSYMLKGRYSAFVEKLAKRVLLDLCGFQEDMPVEDLFEGKDPYLYYREELGKLIQERLRRGKNMMQIVMDRYVVEYDKAWEKVLSSFVFSYYTLASRRDDRRLREYFQEYIDPTTGQPYEETKGEFLVELLNYLPYSGLMSIYYFLNKDYRDKDTKLLIELAYGECLAVMHMKEPKNMEDYTTPFGIRSDEDMREVLAKHGRHMSQEQLKMAQDYKWYSMGKYFFAVYYSQLVKYDRSLFTKALNHINALKPRRTVEHLVRARAYENLGRNLQLPEYVQKASEDYFKAKNILKGKECEIVSR